MLLNIDYYFTYKNSLRFLMIQKLGNLTNTYNLPLIRKVIYYFCFKSIEDLNDIQLYNSFYLFKFFLGRKAYFTKTISFYSLGKWYYNFNIQIILNNANDIYLILYYFKNNIILSIDNILIKKGYINNIFFININDMKIFSEIKTNLGLFYLNTSININLYLIGCAQLKKDYIKILKLN